MSEATDPDAAMSKATAPYSGRSGFLALVGRPNVGKSTLTNALVGDKIVITSPLPQTTRHLVRGVVNRPGLQIILVDTPGMHRPRTLLGERLNEMVSQTLAEVDAIGMCLPADQKIGPGDKFLIEQISPRKPAFAIVTKADLAKPEALARKLVEVDGLRDWSDIIPVSATRGYQLDDLLQTVGAAMPAGPPLYPQDEVSDEPIETMIAELIREAALSEAREELPHSLAAQVEEIVEREQGGRLIHAILYVERDSQKGIVIGHQGARLKKVGTLARKGIEDLIGEKVFLDLHVKVAKDWQRDPKQLGRLGF